MMKTTGARALFPWVAITALAVGACGSTNMG